MERKKRQRSTLFLCARWFRRKRLVVKVVCIILLAISLFPIYWIMQTSVKPETLIISHVPQFVFDPVSKHYKYLFTSRQNFPRFLGNSLIIAFSTGICTVVFGSLAAYGFARYKFKGSSPILFWMLTLRMVPPVAFSVPIYMIMQSLNLIDTHLAVTWTHLIYTLPLGIWVMINFFSNLPVELEQAAMVDGCSVLGSLWRITLPLSFPGLVAVFILSFIASLNEFLFALILTFVRAKTMPIALVTFVSTHMVNWGGMAAGCVITILPAILVCIIAQKYLLTGLTAGAIK